MALLVITTIVIAEVVKAIGAIGRRDPQHGVSVTVAGQIAAVGYTFIRPCDTRRFRPVYHVVVILLAVGVVVDYQPERFGYQTGVGVFQRTVEVWRVVVAGRVVGRAGDLHCRWLVVDLDAESSGTTVGIHVLDRYRAALDAEDCNGASFNHCQQPNTASPGAGVPLPD